MGTLTVRESAAAHRRYPVAAEEDVGALRRAVRALSDRLPERPGLPAGAAELVATELGTNLLRHAEGGYVLVRPLESAAGGGLELIAVDRGPGLPAHVLRALREGTAPVLPPLRRGGPGVSLGVGLAAVRRRADVFDCHSTPAGTILLARLHAGTVPGRERSAGESGSAREQRWLWGAVDVPFGGDGPSGDAWAVAAAAGRLAAFVVDGLGHGPEAAAAARAAVGVFDRTALPEQNGQGAAQDWLAETTGQMHQAMRATRGGVLGACLVDPAAAQLVFGGVGNITGRIVTASGERRHLLSHPGTLGTALPAPRLVPAAHPWPPGATLILASDGIDTRFDPAAHRGLLACHPAVIAALIHRDHSRGRDDATVLVVRQTDHALAGGGAR